MDRLPPFFEGFPSRLGVLFGTLVRKLRGSRKRTCRSSSRAQERKGWPVSFRRRHAAQIDARETAQHRRLVQRTFRDRGLRNVAGLIRAMPVIPRCGSAHRRIWLSKAVWIGDPPERKVADPMDEEVLRQLASSIFRSTITATLPSALRPDLSDCSPALMASMVLSIVLPICGTTSPCTAHSIARVMPRWRKAFPCRPG